MNLYSYSYLSHSSNLMSTVLIALAILLAIIFIYFGIKYWGNRKTLKYRNILITIFISAVLLICVQIGHLQDLNSTKSQVGQTVQVMRNVSMRTHTPIKDIYSSSSNFTNGMLIKAGQRFYTVNANSDNSAYQLKQAIPASNQINYVHHRNRLNLNPHFDINNSQWLQIALKFTVGIILFILQINLLGKNNLAPNNALDQVVNYVLGGIVGGIIYNSAITLLNFIIVILIWSVLVFIVKVLIDNSAPVKKFIEGKPQIIINNGKIDVDTALKNGLSASDIIFKLREAGVSNYQDIKRVILEQNGRFSVENVHDKRTDYPLIEDGHVNEDMLRRMHHTKKWLKGLLKLKHTHLKNIFLGQLSDGELLVTNYPSYKNQIEKFTPRHSINLKEITKEIKTKIKKHSKKNHKK